MEAIAGPSSGPTTPTAAPSQNIDDLSSLIIALASDSASGVSNDDLSKAFPKFTAQTRVAAINKLLTQGLIEVLQKGNSLLYRVKDTSKKSAGLAKGADAEEKIVYSIIEEGASRGIWIRDIRTKSNLTMMQLNKCLKSLENKKLIKAVKSVNASKKKVYMLYNLEPDRTVTGGAWYQDQDFESEFVDVLNQQCFRFLQMRREKASLAKEGPIAARTMSCCTVREVHKFISDLGISKVNLDEEDLQTILKTVVYDGKAEEIVQPDGSFLYRAICSPLLAPGLVQIPCGICPIIQNCSTCGEITPKICQYMNDWLD